MSPMATKKTKAEKVETRGRKPLPPGEKRSEKVHIRLTPDELEAFGARAENLGMDVATWVRMIARREAGLVK